MSVMSLPVRCALGLLLAVSAGAVSAQALASNPSASLIAGFGPGPDIGAPWRLVGVPGQKMPFTRYRVESVDGAPVLRLEAQASYGNLVHELPIDGPTPGRLSWRWRLGEPVAGADLREKAGDDVPLKVCALFDLPIERVPFVERQLLRLARKRTGEELPAATLCYVWDARLPAQTVLRNAYSARVRYLVLRSGEGALAAWQRESRDLAADFLRAFGDETQEVPGLKAIAVGADADNTGGRSLAWLADLQLSPAAR